MKKILYLFSVTTLLAIYSFAPQKNKGKESPDKVAYNFLLALEERDFTKAKTFATEATGEFLDMFAIIAGMAEAEEDVQGVKEKPEKMNIKVDSKVIIDGDKATVTFTSDEKPGTQSLKLVRENGQWLVQQTKDDMVPSESDSK